MLARLAGIDSAAQTPDGSIHEYRDSIAPQPADRRRPSAGRLANPAPAGGAAAHCGMALTPVCAPGLPRLPCALRRLWCPRRRCGAMPPCGEVGQVAEVILGLAHLIRVAQGGAEKPLVVWFKRDHPLALGEHEPPERHHPLAAHGFANDRKGLLPDRRAGDDIIRAIEEALVDRGVRHKSVDLDGVGALDLDRFELGVLNDEVLALGHLVAAAFVRGGDRLAS